MTKTDTQRLRELAEDELDRCERILTACTCIPDYKIRGLTDPQCAACNMGAEVIDSFRAMRARIAELEAEREWRPIESAPSGKPVLVYYENELGKARIIKARHIARFTEESGHDLEEGVDEYDEANDRYTYCEGWWEMVDNWDDFAFVKVYQGQPTHWKPLPDPPSLVPVAEVW